ncbi:MAG: hypothetical protein J6P03_05830 [Opitutales bacterium]|nr:hypothetical protein [Opitutales bacterium]
MNKNNIMLVLKRIFNNKNSLFKGALCVRNNFSTDIFHSIDDWNNPKLWKNKFPSEDIKDIYFFADNILSYQYGVLNEDIVMLNPEDSSIEKVASSIDEWFSIITSDSVTYLYCDILEEWENKNGRVLLGERLIPSLPFILGGDYSLDNFVKCTEVEAMDYYSQFAKKLHNLQDGSRVSLKFEE